MRLGNAVAEARGKFAERCDNFDIQSRGIETQRDLQYRCHLGFAERWITSCVSIFQRMSLTSNISGDTIAVHLSDMGNKQVFTKTGYYKVPLDLKFVQLTIEKKK